MRFISLFPAFPQCALPSLDHLQVRDSLSVSQHAHADDVSSGNCASWKKRKFNRGETEKRWGDCLDEAMGGEGTGGAEARKCMKTDNLLLIANEYRTILST